MYGARFRVPAFLLIPALTSLGCADDPDQAIVAATSTGGASGAGGSSAGTGGGAGASGKGGAAGKGTAGTGGTTTAGTGGAGGSSGTGGSGGTAGGGGGGGAAGKGGSAGTGGAAGSSGVKHFCDLPPGPSTNLKVPDGFCVRVYAENKVVTEPRTVRIAPNGDVFVGSPATSTPGGSFGGLGGVVVLPDDNHDGRADGPVVYAGGGAMTGGACDAHDKDPNDLACIHGIAFIDGYLYLTRWNDVRRFAYKDGDRQAPGTSELVATLGMEKPLDWRFTHTLDRAANGDVMVSRGRYDSSTCSGDSMSEGSVFRIPVGGGVPSTIQLVSNGFRNPMYLRCHPTQDACFANELSGDGWDGVGGREKLVHLAPGENWGYPCCVDKGVPINGGTATLCDGVGTSTVAIQLHDTPFGLDFNRGSFPGQYKDALFIANHGEVGSWIGSGVVWYATDPQTKLPLEQPDPTAPAPIFIDGFGHGAGTVNGRATDVAFAPDGRMFVIDDASSQVWWVAPVDLEVPAGW